jgi:very-short-patch-repair endonuclease
MPIGNHICDFLCRAARLVIEVDGGQHDRRSEQDAIRTARIEAEGYRVIRFWNTDVMDNLDGVLATITETLTAIAAEGPPPTPSRKR